jgi:hypothetical protein
MAGPVVYGAPPPTTSSSGKGCLVTFLIVLGVVIIGGAALTFYFVHRVSDTVAASVGANECPFASSSDVSSALGGSWNATQFGSLTGGLNTFFDNRVISSAPSCNLTNNGSGSTQTGEVLKYDGGDAADKFQAELTKAKGSPDNSGPVTVTSSNYYLKDGNVGDQSFCTKADTSNPSAGVLARKGNSLVYVSFFSTPDITGSGSDSDQSNCDLAQKLAQKVLG